VAGTVASTLRDGEDEHDIRVELAPEYREDLQSVLNLRIPGRNPKKPGVFPVPLSSVAGYELAGGTGSIQHIDQDLVVSITGGVSSGFNENAVRAEVQAAIDAYPVPEGFHIATGGADDEQRNAQEFLGRAFTIAIVLILMVLVTQFNSLAIPLLILATVVLSLIGVLWGLIITGTPFGIIMTGIGVISLAGVVVNNAIVLLDYVEQLQREGLKTRAALVEAGLVRFRPVMLTAITTILGLVPMAVGVSFDFSRMRLAIGGSSSEWWGPMAVAVIFGLGFATILTLVMVPTFYSILHDMRELMSKLFERRPKVTSTPTVLLLALAVGSAPMANAVGLDELQTAAIENSQEMAYVTESRIQSDEVVNQVRSAVMPRVSANANYTMNQYEMVMDPTAGVPEEFADVFDSDPIVIQEQRYMSAGLTVTQAIYDPRTMPAWRSARYLASAAAGEESRVEQRVASGAVKVAYMVQEARGGVALAQRSLEVAREQVTMAERGVASGSLTARDTVQANLGVSRAERDLRATEDGLSQLERTLSIMTGFDRDVSLELPEVFDIPSSLEQALAEATANRADMGAAQARSQAAFHHAKTSRWTPLPSVSATLLGNWSQNLGFSDEPLTWMAFFEAKWNLFDGGYTTAVHRSDMSRWRASQAAIEQLGQSVADEVEAAYRAVELSRSALTSINNEVELAAENLRMADQSMATGSLSWLELELARLGWETAVFAQLRAESTLMISMIDLVVATGGQL
jgi:outer membrane protein TolC